MIHFFRVHLEWNLPRRSELRGPFYYTNPREKKNPNQTTKNPEPTDLIAFQNIVLSKNMHQDPQHFSCYENR